MREKKAVIRDYEDRVVDLTRRNRLLKYPKTVRSIEIQMPLDEFQSRFGFPTELLIEFPHKEILQKDEEQLQETLLPEEELKAEEDGDEKRGFVPPTNIVGQKLLTTLSSLRLDTKRNFEERGLHTLFLAIGRVKWQEPTSKISLKKSKVIDYDAPILLVPIKISEKKLPKQTIIESYLDVNEIEVNQVLNLFLKKFFNTRSFNMPEELPVSLPELLENLSKQIKKIFSEIKITPEITNEIQIGQYNFSGQEIYKDLSDNEDEILLNPFIDALCTHIPIIQQGATTPIENPDEFLKAENDFNVLDADTSQLEVIQKAVEGCDLNVQGPPGTGKSQTIVNIIASFLARDLTVLFVCEKKVAMEVVLRNLRKGGLDKLCLPLFQHNADKKVFAKSVIEDRDTVIRNFNSKKNDLNALLIDREQKIKNLRAYALALGETVEPLGKSVYWVHGELAKYQNLEQLKISIPWRGESPLKLTFGQYKRILETLDNINPVYNIPSQEETTHWKNIKSQYFTPDFANRISHTLNSLLQILKTLDSQSLKFIELKSIVSAKNLLALKPDVVSIGEITINLLDDLNIFKIDSNLTTVKGHLVNYNQLLDSYSKKYAVPTTWSDKSLGEFDKYIKPDSTIEEVKTAYKNLTELKGHIKDLKKCLAEIKIGDKLTTTTLKELLEYKNILQVDPLIKLLSIWSTSTALQSALNQLEHLSQILNNLEAVKATLDRWAIIKDALEKDSTLGLAERFEKKYSNILRGLNGHYKQDCIVIAKLCNSTTPKNHSEYVEIVSAMKDWFLLQEKYKLLSDNFSKEHIQKNEVLNEKQIILLQTAIKNVLHWLKGQDKKDIPEAIEEFIKHNGNQQEVTELFTYVESLIHFFTDFESLFVSENLANTISIDEFLLLYPKIDNIFSIIIQADDQLSLLLSNEDMPKTVEEIQTDIAKVNNLFALYSDMQKLKLEKLFKGEFNLQKTISDSKEFEVHIEAINTLAKMLKKIDEEGSSEHTFKVALEILQELRTYLSSWDDQIGKYSENIIALNLLFENSESTETYEDKDITDYIQTLEIMLSDVEGLETWMQYRKYEKQLIDLGLEWFLQDTKAEKVENPKALFAKSVWGAWLEAYYKTKPALRNFTVAEHKKTIKQFHTLENDILQINAQRILQKRAKDMNDIRFKNAILDKDLTHQSQLKKPSWSIRRLVNESGQSLLNYKPCWMMSPLTLSSYIPYGKLKFDVVIFDEASQMRVEHALSAISRAQQVIILGDEEQLPPTAFFDVSSDSEDEDDGAEENYESILHATKEILPGATKMLSYHYRSKYEDLIKFSNHHIYGDKLTTFPNPSRKIKGVEFSYVEDGWFDRGGSTQNIPEAKRVIELCAKYALEQPEKSLGVIAFSKAQERAIRDQLIEYLKSHPELQEKLNEDADVDDTESENFFIKNLESVQGDERDIIILSVAYGKDKTGHVYYNFGPINKPTGYRRLNVAVTRAREKIVCVASVRASDLHMEKPSRGALLLQQYLEYAEKGMPVLEASKLKQDNEVAFDSEFEEEVSLALTNLGFSVDKQVGASGFKIDLAIRNPRNNEEYILGIECDGAAYHSSYSARVNDKIRQSKLEDLGWEIYRIWSQDWIMHRGEILDDLINRIQED